MHGERAQRGFWLADDLARLLLLLAGLAVAGYFALEWLTSPQEPQAELQLANPGWTVDKPRHMGLSLSDGSGPDLFINGDDAGPLRLQRLDCAQLLPSLPAWAARLPPGRTVGCLQMGETAPLRAGAEPPHRHADHRAVVAPLRAAP